MSCNTALTVLSHPTNEHLAHFFVSLVARTFLRGWKKKKKFLKNYIKSYLSIIRVRFIRFEFPFGQRGKLGLLCVFLIKIAQARASLAIDFFFLVDSKCFY